MKIDREIKPECLVVYCFLPLLASNSILVLLSRHLGVYSFISPLRSYVNYLMLTLPFSIVTLLFTIHWFWCNINRGCLSDTLIVLLNLVLLLAAIVIEVYFFGYLLPWFSFYFVIVIPTFLCIISLWGNQWIKKNSP